MKPLNPPNKEILLKQFGKRVKELRKAKGLTIEQTLDAEFINSRSYYQRIESGESFPSLQNLHYLSKRFGVKLSDFFSDIKIAQKRSSIKDKISHLLESLSESEAGVAYRVLVSALKFKRV